MLDRYRISRVIYFPVAALLLGAPTTGSVAPVAAQTEQGDQTDPLLRRWVGHHKGRPIFFDFHSDSVLVVNDIHPLNFRFTWDSIIAYGDTSFAVRYRFSYDRLLITTEDGVVFTMATQDVMARPLGAPLGSRLPALWVAETTLGTIHLQMRRGGWARWRLYPGGSWEVGEWNRRAREISLTWVKGVGEVPDSTVWEGVYDAPRALIFEETTEGSGITIFRRTFQ